MSMNSNAFASYGLDPAASDRLPDGWRNGAHDLALAILQQAIDDVRRFRDARDVRSRRMYRLAYTWICGTTHGHLFSFESVCDALGLSPSELRSKLLATAPPVPADAPRRRSPRPRGPRAVARAAELG